MDLAERMAKAYYEAGDWEGTPRPDLSWEAYKAEHPEIVMQDIACMKAAIAELYKPTDTMKRAGFSTNPILAYNIFTDMIDAGLAESAGTKDEAQLSLLL